MCQPSSDRKSTRLNSSHLVISYAVFCLKKKTNQEDSGLLEQLTDGGRGDLVAPRPVILMHGPAGKDIRAGREVCPSGPVHQENLPRLAVANQEHCRRWLRRHRLAFQVEMSCDLGRQRPVSTVTRMREWALGSRARSRLSPPARKASGWRSPRPSHMKALA